MKRSTLIVLVLFFLACGCGRSPKIRKVTQDSVILAFGDSITYGVGAAAEESYPVVLAQLLGCRVVNAGVSGEVTDDGLRRYPEVLAENAPDLVILCLGGNDMLRKRPREGMKQNLDAMIAMTRERGIDLILVAVPEPGLLLSPPDLYAELAKKHGVPCARDVVSDVLSKGSLKSDYVHPNRDGYRLMAEALAELVRSAGK